MMEKCHKGTVYERVYYYPSFSNLTAFSISVKVLDGESTNTHKETGDQKEEKPKERQEVYIPRLLSKLYGDSVYYKKIVAVNKDGKETLIKEHRVNYHRSLLNFDNE